MKIRFKEMVTSLFRVLINELHISKPSCVERNLQKSLLHINFHPPSSWNLYLWRNDSFLKEGHTYPIAQWNGSKSLISEVCFAKSRLFAFLI